MKKTQLSHWRLAAALGSALAAAVICLTGLKAGAADTPKPATTATNTVPVKAKPASKRLTGAELYAINCNRCHPERYPTEFNATQWKTLITHMRVRANLPAKQANEILRYLKEESGN